MGCRASAPKGSQAPPDLHEVLWAKVFDVARAEAAARAAWGESMHVPPPGLDARYWLWAVGCDARDHANAEVRERAESAVGDAAKLDFMVRIHGARRAVDLKECHKHAGEGCGTMDAHDGPGAPFVAEVTEAALAVRWSLRHEWPWLRMNLLPYGAGLVAGRGAGADFHVTELNRRLAGQIAQQQGPATSRSLTQQWLTRGFINAVRRRDAALVERIVALVDACDPDVRVKFDVLSPQERRGRPPHRTSTLRALLLEARTEEGVEHEHGVVASNAAPSVLAAAMRLSRLDDATKRDERDRAFDRWVLDLPNGMETMVAVAECAWRAFVAGELDGPGGVTRQLPMFHALSLKHNWGREVASSTGEVVVRLMRRRQYDAVRFLLAAPRAFPRDYLDSTPRKWEHDSTSHHIRHYTEHGERETERIWRRGWITKAKRLVWQEMLSATYVDAHAPADLADVHVHLKLPYDESDATRGAWDLACSLLMDPRVALPTTSADLGGCRWLDTAGHVAPTPPPPTQRQGPRPDFGAGMNVVEIDHEAPVMTVGAPGSVLDARVVAVFADLFGCTAETRAVHDPAALRAMQPHRDASTVDERAAAVLALRRRIEAPPVLAPPVVAPLGYDHAALAPRYGDDGTTPAVVDAAAARAHYGVERGSAGEAPEVVARRQFLLGRNAFVSRRAAAIVRGRAGAGGADVAGGADELRRELETAEAEDEKLAFVGGDDERRASRARVAALRTQVDAVDAAHAEAEAEATREYEAAKVRLFGDADTGGAEAEERRRAGGRRRRRDRRRASGSGSGSDHHAGAGYGSD